MHLPFVGQRVLRRIVDACLANGQPWPWHLTTRAVPAETELISSPSTRVYEGVMRKLHCIVEDTTPSETDRTVTDVADGELEPM